MSGVSERTISIRNTFECLSRGFFFFFFTSGFLAVEIRIQTLAAHLGDLLHLAVCHVLQQPSQVCPRVHRLQLFFIQVQHLVDAPFVLELRIKNGIVAWAPFDHRYDHRWKHLTSFPFLVTFMNVAHVSI